MTLEEQLGSILKKLKSTIANITTIESTVNARANDVNTINTDVQAKAEEMKKYVDTMNSSINTLNTLEQQVTDVKNTVDSTTDRAEKMLKETQAIRDTLTDALVWKGSVDNYAALPTENVRVGDTYNVTAADSAHGINAGDNVVWDGTKWDSMGGIMNVDSLAVKGQDANFKDVTATTFHGTLNGKADSATTADVAKTVAWDNIGGKPATFPSDIQFDDTPTAGSSNAVKSSGIKSALDQKLSTTGGTLTGALSLSGNSANINTGGGALSGSSTSINIASKSTVDFTDLNTRTRTSYIDATNGKYHGDVIGTADRATIAVNDGSGRNIVNTYPPKTGEGASGIWAISIAGNAASATKATQDANGANIASTYLKKAGDTATGKITFNSTDLNALPEVKKTSDDYFTGVRLSSKSKFLGAVGKRLSNGEDLLNLRSDNSSTDIVLDSRNYNTYVPTKTGAGASGTWGISVSGNAATATKLAAARTFSLKGKATGSGTFDGSANATINVTAVSADTATKATQDANGAVIADTYLKKSGGTMSGALNFANSTKNIVGDDVAMGDLNRGGTLGIQGQNGDSSILLLKNGAGWQAGGEGAIMTYNSATQSLDFKFQ